ncbi:Glutamyl-tRNA reductase, partial [Bienertia sinuspersici]
MKLIEHKQKVKWARNIWNRYNQPKHRFCSWLAIQNKLPTADRLRRMGAEIQQGRLFKWINKRGNKNKVYKVIWNVAATAIVYSIWQERNGVIHGSPVLDMQQVMQKIKFW